MSSELNEVEYFTELAHELLQKRKDNKAIYLFKKALNCAKQRPSDDTVVAKATVNFGAALISVHRSKEALKILDRAFSSPPNDDAVSGDLFFNLAVLHQQLGKKLEARKYLQKSFYHYELVSDSKLLQAGIACKLAALCVEQSDHSAAVDAYEKAASIYGADGQIEQQALCLYHKALALEASGNVFDAVTVANECEAVCSRSLEISSSIGRLQNELGLFFAKYKNFSKAIECFNKSVMIMQVIENGIKFEAVVLQNIGALHNCQSSFKQSVEFNKRAAALHVKTGCRNGQGQCFMNIAYAYTQLNDLDSAGEYYLHALQAMEDTGDKNGEWQASEGLSTVAYKQNKLERCCDYLRKALIAASTNYVSADHVESSRGDSNSTHLEMVRQRLFNKLSHVLRLQRQDGGDEVRLEKSPVPVLKDQPRASNEHVPVEAAQSNPATDRSTRAKKNVRLVSSAAGRRMTSSTATSDMAESRDLEAEKLQEQYRKLYCESDNDEGDESSCQTFSDDTSLVSVSEVSEVSYPSSMPQHTAPRVPQQVHNTYLAQVGDNQMAVGARLGAGHANPAATDPNYASMPAAATNEDLFGYPVPQSRDIQEGKASHSDDVQREGPPTLPLRRISSDQSRDTIDEPVDVVKLPRKGSRARPSTPSQACCTQ